MPESIGPLKRPREEIRGGDAQYNAALVRRTLTGEQTGAAADIVALNAGAALYVSDGTSSIAEGVRQAQDALRVGLRHPGAQCASHDIEEQADDFAAHMLYRNGGGLVIVAGRLKAAHRRSKQRTC